MPGSGGGIGEGIALRLAAEGAKVIVNDINVALGEKVVAALTQAGGPLDEERKARFRASIPLGRFSTALDVANAALYLASDEADFISGVCIEVDGARCV